MDLVPALEEEVFLVVDQLLANSRVIGKGDDRVDHFASVGARLVGRYPLVEHFAAQVLVLLGPGTGLLWGAFILGALFIRAREEAK